MKRLIALLMCVALLGSCQAVDEPSTTELEAISSSSAASSTAQQPRETAERPPWEVGSSPSSEGLPWEVGSSTEESHPWEVSSSLPEYPWEDGYYSRLAFWVPNGKSFHFTIYCATLARSKTILTGTVQGAIDAGKDDPCNVCANGI